MADKNSRGFVTIATGSERYYRLAETLLRSYRMQECNDYPFTIICDRENEYTKAFDCVVVMETAKGSYLDKLQLFRYTPYEYTIFVDADSLFLNSPEQLWQDFGHFHGISCYGKTLEPNSCLGWFQKENSGKYKDSIDYSINLHGGLYYFTKTELTNSVFELAMDLAGEYEQYNFRDFVYPADEPVIAMSMAIYGLHPNEKSGRILFLPALEGKIKIDWRGQLFLNKQMREPIILHFATKNTKRFIYRYLSDNMEILFKNVQHDAWIQKQKYCFLWLKCLPLEMKSLLWYRIKRIMKCLLPVSVINTIRRKVK